jgi:hypothetical protein
LLIVGITPLRCEIFLTTVALQIAIQYDTDGAGWTSRVVDLARFRRFPVCLSYGILVDAANYDVVIFPKRWKQLRLRAVRTLARQGGFL